MRLLGPAVVVEPRRFDEAAEVSALVRRVDPGLEAVLVHDVRHRAADETVKGPAPRRRQPLHGSIVQAVPQRRREGVVHPEVGQHRRAHGHEALAGRDGPVRDQSPALPGHGGLVERRRQGGGGISPRGRRGGLRESQPHQALHRGDVFLVRHDRQPAGELAVAEDTVVVHAAVRPVQGGGREPRGPAQGLMLLQRIGRTLVYRTEALLEASNERYQKDSETRSQSKHGDGASSESRPSPPLNKVLRSCDVALPRGARDETKEGATQPLCIKLAERPSVRLKFWPEPGTSRFRLIGFNSHGG
ncbi:hypothetical protein VTK73DRAFT_1794 [Phialemonium thermophilum]|uniref:Uncharacterized protein n=1 Tax=Phialemonium thermophilum TaxID=223376 RepID=A0ABR3VSY9_9PEZI